MRYLLTAALVLLSLLWRYRVGVIVAEILFLMYGPAVAYLLNLI